MTHFASHRSPPPSLPPSHSSVQIFGRFGANRFTCFYDWLAWIWDSYKPATPFIPFTKVEIYGINFLVASHSHSLSLSLSIALIYCRKLFIAFGEEKKTPIIPLKKDILYIYCFGYTNRFESRICWIVTESIRAHPHHIQNVCTLAVHELNIYYLFSWLLACLRIIWDCCRVWWWKRRSFFFSTDEHPRGQQIDFNKGTYWKHAKKLGLISWHTIVFHVANRILIESC